MRSKVKNLLKKGLSEEKLREIGNKLISSRLTVNGYVNRLEAEGAVMKDGDQYKFRKDHHLMS